MLIDVTDITSEGATIVGEEPAAILAVDDDIQFATTGPVAYDLRLSVYGEELLAQGRLSTSVTFRCARCGKLFDRKVVDQGFLCERDLSEEDETVDLTPDIREAILLDFPAYPVCREDCRGLCSNCGKDLSEGPCNCDKPADDRWGVLDNL